MRGTERPDDAMPDCGRSWHRLGRDRGAHRTGLGGWWRAEFDYTWMPAFLERRGLMGLLRGWVSLWCVVFGAYVLLLLAQMRSGSHAVDWVLPIVVAAGSFGAALAAPFVSWPSERWSVGLVLWAETALAVAVYWGSRGTAVPIGGSGLFVVLGIYVTLMHSARLLIVHFVFAAAAVGAASIGAILGSSAVDFAALAARLLILVGLATTVPLIVHIGMQFLKEDAQDSHRDPLTGLSNLRGLSEDAQGLYTSARTGDTVIVTALIDLDDFKSLNDRDGHAAGDQTLCTVGARIAAATPATALVGRLGGDEFAIVMELPIREVDTVLGAVHDAVQVSPDIPVSASIGAWVRTGLVPNSDATKAFARELHRADIAMYEAKESGGGHLVCHGSSVTAGGKLPREFRSPSRRK